MSSTKTPEIDTELFQRTKGRPDDWYDDKPFRILSAFTITQMETLVQQQLPKNWLPFGAPSFGLFPRSNGSMQPILLQAMLRKTD